MMHVHGRYSFVFQEVTEGTESVVTICRYVILPFPIFVDVMLALDLIVQPFFPSRLGLRVDLHFFGRTFLSLTGMLS